MSFISSEIDLDRDVPDGEIEVDSSDKPVVVDYLEEIMWLDSDTSHEILTPLFDVDVDENGPFIVNGLLSWFITL